MKKEYDEEAWRVYKLLYVNDFGVKQKYWKAEENRYM